ncbi:MAG: efflux RND transporter periplasmic adaptor subunit [bacterium]|nr:efflux RND transporter periplasmic adaptor subunit [bacterium]
MTATKRHPAPALMLFAVLLAFAGTGAKPAPKSPTVPVVTGAVKVQPAPLLLEAVGTVEPIESVAVRPQVGGVITRVAFTEGDDVRAGQPLFQIDPRPLQAALEAAQAQLARDEAQAANADAQSARYAKLAAKDYVTREQADAARTQADVFRAAVQADRSAVEQAKLNLAYATVSSPVAGRTGSILVTKGNVVAPNGGPLVVVNQLSPIRVSFAVPADRLPQVRKHTAGGALAVHARPSRDGAGEALVGRLVFVDNAVGAGTGTVTLKAEFPNEDGALWPGQFVDVDLVLAIETDALTVPAAAVVTGRDGLFVFVVGDDRKAEKRAVEVDRTIDGLAVVRGDLRDGEAVVIDGQMRLAPGTVVEIKTAKPATGGAR